MEDRPPETRRRVRTTAPAAGFFLWIVVATCVLIGIVFAIVYLT